MCLYFEKVVPFISDGIGPSFSNFRIRPKEYSIVFYVKSHKGHVSYMRFVSSVLRVIVTTGGLIELKQ